MKIQKKDCYHGAALTQIVEYKSFKALNKADGHYKINHDTRLMLKTAQHDDAPWQFTVNQNDLTVIREGMDSDDKFSLCLVCGLETVCLLDSDQVKTLLDLKSDKQQWLRIETKKRSSLWAKSRITELSHAIPHRDFPDRLFSA